MEITEITRKEPYVKLEAFCQEDTLKIGACIGSLAKPGEIYCLDGGLGAGKTTFTQGVAKGLGITEPVNSPTFTILQEYERGRLPFYHFDVYRIAELEEMEEIGYEDYFYGNGVCLIEWACLIEGILPEQVIWVKISKELEKGFDYRIIELIRG